MVSRPIVGVLALQGDFAEHEFALRAQGLHTRQIRQPAHLAAIDGLVLPGGESTTLLNLMEDGPWFEALRTFHREGGAMLGTCAGAILLARRVVGPPQASVGLLDAVIRRNGFGRQVDSFEADLEVAGYRRPLRAVFIRAPRFVKLGPRVEVLARLDRGGAITGEPVLVREGSILAATFHPELTEDSTLHRQFVELASEGGTSRTGRFQNQVGTAPRRRPAVR